MNAAVRDGRLVLRNGRIVIGDCPECCGGGGGPPGTQCCGRIPDNCGFTQTARRWVLDWAVTSTHTSSTSWLRNIGGGRFTFLPSGTLSRTGTNTITTDSDACSSVASHFETFTDGLRACAAAPQPYSSMHSINAGGEVDISYPSNGIWPNVPQSNLVATFPIPDPSEPAQIQPVTCDLSITGGVEDVDVCFGTSGNPAADWGWASCNFLGFADGISGKCFATIGFGSFPPATTPSTRTASITGFSLAVVRGSGVCASGMSVDVSFVKTASNVNTGHTFRVESRLTLTARCLDVAPCVSGIESRDPNLPTLPCDGCGGAGLPQSPEDAEAMLR